VFKSFFTIKILTMLGWSLAIVSSIIFTAYTQRQHSLESARYIANANFNKDQAFRRWASTHGGVYVPIDMKRTPPSPYLAHIPNRDITTLTGERFTLMNPAYMLRQMMSEYSGLYGVKGHITALEILNPKSKPDAWEKKALLSFQKDSNIQEISELIELDNQSYMRLIRPMENSENCLKCHGHQPSYIDTPTAGGVSVTVPLKEIYALEKKSLTKTLLIHLLFWLVGMFLFYILLSKEERSKAKISELLKESELKNTEIKVANKLLKEQQNELDKKAKDLERSSQYKSEFLANMSHEIRTPLNAIMGFIELTKKQNRDTKINEYMNVIDSSSKDLIRIIEDVLDFSKIESGKLVIDKIDFNTREELSIVTKLFEVACSQKNIELSISFDENVPTNINADPLRTKQVISNLISNAIKFTEADKHIIISISYKNSDLFISVLDEGKGIAKDKLEHIFESFNQEDNSTTRKFGGTGLGLSISKALVDLMGGNLKVKSQPNKGSEFYFHIPISTVKEIDKNTENIQTSSFKGKRVLMVEDNKSNQLLMNIILEEMEFDVDVADDGLLGVEAFKTNNYDIILMDENMPNMNGIEATGLMLKYEKEHNIEHTPIVALTANAIKGDKERFLESGMDEYISKPIDIQKLNTILEKFLL